MDNKDLSPEVLLRQDNPNGDLGSTQYSDKPIVPTENKIVIQQLDIRQAIRNEVDIEKWRDGLRIAESRYFPNRTWAYDLYEDVLLDGHLTGIITKRLDTVLNKPLYFEVNGKKVEEMDDLINTLQFRLVMRKVLETQLWGITGLEFIPGKDFQPRPIPRKHIKPKWQRITIDQNSTEGIDYTTLSNVWVIGEPEDLGLLMKCAPYVIYKRNMYADWAQYVEIFGMPVRLMYYNAHDEQAKIELKEVLDSTGSALALMIPEGTRFEMPPMPSANGTGELQNTFKDSLNAEMSIIILGNTETTTTRKSGTGAQSATHQKEQQEITRSDMIYMEATLNSPQFLQILKSYGYPVDGGRFCFTRELDVDFLKTRAAVDGQMPETLPISDDYWYDTYGIPKPDDYDKMKKELVDAQKEQKQQEDIANDPKNKVPKNVNLRARNPVFRLRSLLADFFDPARR